MATDDSSYVPTDAGEALPSPGDSDAVDAVTDGAEWLFVAGVKGFGYAVAAVVWSALWGGAAYSRWAQGFPVLAAASAALWVSPLVVYGLARLFVFD